MILHDEKTKMPRQPVHRSIVIKYRKWQNELKYLRAASSNGNDAARILERVERVSQEHEKPEHEFGMGMGMKKRREKIYIKRVAE